MPMKGCAACIAPMPTSSMPANRHSPPAPVTISAIRAPRRATRPTRVTSASLTLAVDAVLAVGYADGRIGLLRDGVPVGEAYVQHPVLGQLAAIFIVVQGLEFDVPVIPCVAIIGLSALLVLLEVPVDDAA